MRIYGIRHWIEQSYKQVKDELGWADFQVRSDIAIRRHQVLVNCAFSFCWDAWFGASGTAGNAAGARGRGGERGARTPLPRSAAVRPRALRAVRAWLTPWIALQRWWTAWSERAPAPAAASHDDSAAGRPPACTSTSRINKLPLNDL